MSYSEAVIIKQLLNKQLTSRDFYELTNSLDKINSQNFCIVF